MPPKFVKIKKSNRFNLELYIFIPAVTCIRSIQLNITIIYFCSMFISKEYCDFREFFFITSLQFYWFLIVETED